MKYAIALTSLLLTLTYSAHAEVNLPITCTDASADGQPRAACANASLRYAPAGSDTLVRVCTATQFCGTAQVWKRYGTVTAAEWLEVCSADKPADSTVTECRGTTSTQFGALRMVRPVEAAQLLEAEPSFPGTFTVTPESCVSPCAVTITWDVRSFTGGTCTASGSWTGTKALNGTQQVTNLTADANYTLTCTRTGTGTGSAVLEWTAPTKNTDGSTLTNLAGFRALYGTAATSLTQTVQIPSPAAVTYTVTNLNPGTWFFALRAYNSVGGESINSAVASKVIAPNVESVSTARTVTVTPAPPEPPTLRVVQADVFNATADYAILAFRPSLKYGTAALGTPCDQSKPVHGGYFPVPLDSVQWISTGRTKYPVARCELQ